jgi:hypothetical protein
MDGCSHANPGDATPDHSGTPDPYSGSDILGSPFDFVTPPLISPLRAWPRPAADRSATGRTDPVIRLHEVPGLRETRLRAEGLGYERLMGCERLKPALGQELLQLLKLLWDDLQEVLHLMLLNLRELQQLLQLLGHDLQRLHELRKRLLPE